MQLTVDIIARLAGVREQLSLAHSKDPELEIFGADYHEYEMGPPISQEAATKFEDEYGITLPAHFLYFITMVGHGGPGNFGGAGPFYGIYALDDFGYFPMLASRMSTPGIISTDLKQDEWKEHTEQFETHTFGNDIEKDAAYDTLFNGLLPIGTQGCSFQTMLVLHGKDAGRVVYIDQDLAMPWFPDAPDFASWYLAWIDKLTQS